MTERNEFIPDKNDLLKALAVNELTITAQFTQSSNCTFLAQVGKGCDSFPAVYKPQDGEAALWDFPKGTLCQREVAAFLISEALGWDLVPPTVFREQAPLGKGALQLFIKHDPQLHYFSFDEATRQRLKPVVLFDLIVNNADRKSGHVLLDDQNHLWLIDHGTCFHQEFKLRSVIWEFAGQDIPLNLKADIQKLAEALAENHMLKSDLSRLISGQEIRALQTRIKILLKLGSFPYPDKNRRTIPWPPI